VVREEVSLPTLFLHAMNVLSDDEKAFIEATAVKYNKIIKDAVDANHDGDWSNIRVVTFDINQVFVKAMNNEFKPLKLGKTGGIFSLDLVHPNSQGHKAIANEFIDCLKKLIEEEKFFGIKTAPSPFAVPRPR